MGIVLFDNFVKNDTQIKAIELFSYSTGSISLHVNIFSYFRSLLNYFPNLIKIKFNSFTQ